MEGKEKEKVKEEHRVLWTVEVREEVRQGGEGVGSGRVRREGVEELDTRS